MGEGVGVSVGPLTVSTNSPISKLSGMDSSSVSVGVGDGDNVGVGTRALDALDCVEDCQRKKANNTITKIPVKAVMRLRTVDMCHMILMNQRRYNGGLIRCVYH